MGVFPIFQAFRKQSWERSELTEIQRRMYTAEKQENFRWVSKLVATYSEYELAKEDLVDEKLCQWLQEVGQFAEVVYATPSLKLLLRSFDSLNQPGFPLEGYYALSSHPYRSAVLPLPSSLPNTCSQPHESSFTSSGVQLLKSIKGEVAKLPAAVFSRWIHEHGCLSSSRKEKVDQEAQSKCSCSRRRQQIIVSICGTSSVQQAIHDLRAIRRPYPGALGGHGATVHTGFWDLYQGMKSGLMEGISEGLRLSPSTEGNQMDATGTECLKNINDYEEALRELIVTGHSMGGAIAHLLCLDLLSCTLELPEHANSRVPFLPSGSTNSSPVDFPSCNGESFLRQSCLKSLEIVTFGEPRTGNQALVDHWVALKKRHQDEHGIPVREWCVKAYNDGIVVQHLQYHISSEHTGVTSLPIMKFGYRHFSQEPLYTVNGKVYHVPSDERECALFHVASPDPPNSSPPSSQIESDFNCPVDLTTISSRGVTFYPTVNPATTSSIPLSPYGGHNYYNERDLEGGFLRRMEWLERTCFDREGWEEGYRNIIKTRPIRCFGRVLFA